MCVYDQAVFLPEQRGGGGKIEKTTTSKKIGGGHPLPSFGGITVQGHACSMTSLQGVSEPSSTMCGMSERALIISIAYYVVKVKIKDVFLVL